MPERMFPWFPITCVRSDRTEIVLLNALGYHDDTTPPEVTMYDAYEGRWRLISQLLVDSDQEFRFVDTADITFTFRPTIPEDATNTRQLRGRIPLPVDIIGGIMSGTIAEPSISAAVDDNGDVHTIILETDTGLYARFSRTWILMTDISPIENLDIVDLPDSDLEHYDMADDLGKSININALSPINRPAQTATSTPRVLTPVTASVPGMVLISSAADLPEAIEFAATDQGAPSRWYVARRARALGHTDPFPWET